MEPSNIPLPDSTASVNSILLEEYKTKWSYYNNSLDERKNLFDWYFKIVTIPASAFGLTNILSRNFDKNSPFRIEDYESVFFVIFLCGIGLFITYCIATGTAYNYLDRVRHIEKTLKNPAYEATDYVSPNFLRTVGFWRASPIIFINSFIFSVFYHFLHLSTFLKTSIIFLLVTIIHFALYSPLKRIGTSKSKAFYD